MENYSGLELALGGLVVFSVSIFIGCVCFCMRKPNSPKEPSQALNHEIGSLTITMDEIRSEQEHLQSGLAQRLQKLEQWNESQQSTPLFFKSNKKHQVNFMNERLQELYSHLATGLETYPQLTGHAQPEYLQDFHREYREHHEDVRVIAVGFFQAFDEYLSALNKPINESSHLFSG